MCLEKRLWLSESRGVVLWLVDIGAGQGGGGAGHVLVIPTRYIASNLERRAAPLPPVHCPRRLAALCEDVAMRLLPRPPSTRNSSSLPRHSSFRPSVSSVARPVTLGTCSVARRRPRSAVGRARCAECWPCLGGRASRCDSVGYNWGSNNRWRCARIVETIGAKQCLNVLMRTDT